MTTAVPTTEPASLRAGITWEWDRQDLADFPASSWTLKYWFKKTGATGANFSIAASADGDNFSISVAAATTATYTAGDYTWVAVVTAGSDSREVDQGSITVLPRYDQEANLDDRSHARIVLEAIEAVIEGRATKDQEEYTIGSRHLKRTPIKDLMALRDKYRAEVYAEAQGEAAANGKGTSRVVVRL